MPHLSSTNYTTLPLSTPTPSRPLSPKNTFLFLLRPPTSLIYLASLSYYPSLLPILLSLLPKPTAGQSFESDLTDLDCYAGGDIRYMTNKLENCDGKDFKISFLIRLMHRHSYYKHQNFKTPINT